MAAIGAIFLCTVFLIELRENFSNAVVALLYLVPVVISAALWGRLAGISASVLSFFTFLYFFVPPYNTFRVSHLQDLLVMVIFLSVAVLISSLMARIQANLEAVRVREREAVQLYELSQELIGKNTETAVVQTLARHIAGPLPEAIVEVEAFPPSQPVIVRMPDGDQPINQDLLCQKIPLTSPRGSLGEIRIWNISEDQSCEKDRLLQTVAVQGA